MAEDIWVIEVKLDDADPFEYRVSTAERMLKMNVARVFSNANGLPVTWKESNWNVVGMAHTEEEANRKAEHLKSMEISEREHVLATGKSLYLSL